MGLSQTNTTNPIAMPDITTMYHVTGQTDWGCIGTDSITVIVRNQSIVEVPNVFVPGSGPGSELKILSKGIATLKNFSIFNRWGNKVFETSDVNEGWNGKFNGEPQPLGVYVYILEAYTNDGQKIYKQGNITLIR
jgi:gliding motility-associated-like protein